MESPHPMDRYLMARGPRNVVTVGRLISAPCVHEPTDPIEVIGDWASMAPTGLPGLARAREPTKMCFFWLTPQNPSPPISA